MSWSIVYKKAINPDGSLFFPEKISQEFLDNARKTMGTYIFSNQYLNEVFPADEQIFKPAWIKYTTLLPENHNTFAFIDPAISTKDGADYTGLTIISVDAKKDWYVRVAKRARLKPPQIIDMCFEVYREFKPMTIGIEIVGYQEALLYMLEEEMRIRKQRLPIFGVRTGTDKTKEMRIMGLVPRIEWGRCYFSPGLADLEEEMFQFPRGAHDDLLDSLSQHETIVQYPYIKEQVYEIGPNSPGYEKRIIEDYARRANERLILDE